MKTDNVYIAELAHSLKVVCKGTLYDYIYGSGIIQKIKYQPIRYIIVKKYETMSFESMSIDLSNKKKYSCEFPLESGKLFLVPSTMIPFKAIYPDAPRNLSKKKILKMGNSAIQELMKKEEEGKEKNRRSNI